MRTTIKPRPAQEEALKKIERTRQEGQINPRWLFVVFVGMLIVLQIFSHLRMNDKITKLEQCMDISYIERVDGFCYSLHNETLKGTNITWGQYYRNCLLDNLGAYLVEETFNNTTYKISKPPRAT